MTLSAVNLGYERKSVPLLQDVSVAFAKGGITAICGPNGAGKSTLLKLLAGVERPTTGEVLLDGKTLNATPPRERARAIAYVPQLSDIAWDIPVRSLVALGRMAWDGRDEGAVEEAMRSMSVDTFAERRVLSLSGGERARVLLARALAGRPRYLLVDEPLAALDLGQQKAVMNRLIDIAGKGTAVIIVLHDLAMAYNHADTVVVLDHGHSVAAGPPHEALSERSIATVWGIVPVWIGTEKNRALVVR